MTVIGLAALLEHFYPFTEWWRWKNKKKNKLWDITEAEADSASCPGESSLLRKSSSAALSSVKLITAHLLNVSREHLMWSIESQALDPSFVAHIWVCCWMVTNRQHSEISSSLANSHFNQKLGQLGHILTGQLCVQMVHSLLQF